MTEVAQRLFEKSVNPGVLSKMTTIQTRHCERSEAIQSRRHRVRRPLDCFVAACAAPRNDGVGLLATCFQDFSNSRSVEILCERVLHLRAQDRHVVIILMRDDGEHLRCGIAELCDLFRREAEMHEMHG
jgi:hypothetical protein